MTKFVVGDESSIVQATNDDECCELCTFREENSSLCSRWRIEVDEDMVCPNFEVLDS